MKIRNSSDQSSREDKVAENSGNISDSREIFQSIPRTQSNTWKSIIACCNSSYFEAISFWNDSSPWVINERSWTSNSSTSSIFTLAKRPFVVSTRYRDSYERHFVSVSFFPIVSQRFKRQDWQTISAAVASSRNALSRERSWSRVPFQLLRCSRSVF